MISPHFAILGALISMMGTAVYAYLTFKGRVQPNRVSFALWAFSPLIAFAAEIVQHASFEVSLLTFSVGFGPLVVIAFSFANRKAYWKITTFDILCGCVSFLAIILWAITGKGNVAIIFSIVSDFFACIPTLRKSISNPKSENYIAYFAASFGSIVTLLSIQRDGWNFAAYGFPAYIAFISAVLGIIIISPRQKTVLAK